MRSIHIEKFAMVYPANGEIFDKVLDFEVAARFGKHNTDSSHGVVDLAVRAIPEGDKQEVYSIQVLFAFQFQGNESDQDLRDSDAIRKTLIGMSFSTLRGILYEKLSGTPYAAQLLMTVDTSSFTAADKPGQKVGSKAKGKAGK
ncbi:MAG: hypothetical protein KF905_07195 [Flavobacteriales bacterium]|nr:hypothetical protein [Flavobacteriales bacterium]